MRSLSRWGSIVKNRDFVVLLRGFYWIRGLLVGEGHGEGVGLGEWCDDGVGWNWILLEEEKKFWVRKRIS